MSKAIATAGLLLAAMAAAGVAAAEDRTPGFRHVPVIATPISEFFFGDERRRFGELEFLGGLELSAEDTDFGALSGVDFKPDGTLVAVTDTGFWLTAHLVEDGLVPQRLDNARLAPMLDGGGVPFAEKALADAEGLRLVERDGVLTALVSFERDNRLSAFVPDPDFDRARAMGVTLPRVVKGLSANRGLEAVAVAPADGPLAGATVLIAERSLDRFGHHRAWIVDGPQAGEFSIRRTDRFDVTDADFLPNGDLIVLERRFGLGQGIAMRLRRFAAGDLAPGRQVDGQEVAFADLRTQIDNMEGLAVSLLPSGDTVLTVISDDNHSLLQRTLLLRFRWSAAVPPKPVPRPAGAGSGALPPDRGQAAAAPERS